MHDFPVYVCDINIRSTWMTYSYKDYFIILSVCMFEWVSELVCCVTQKSQTTKTTTYHRSINHKKKLSIRC